MMLNSLKQVFVIFFVLLKTVSISADILTAPDGIEYLVESDRRAYHSCIRSKGSLLIIDSEEENEKIAHLLRRNLDLTPNLWISGTDHFSTAKNVSRPWWSHEGKILTYTNWRPNSPDNVNGKEHCVHLASAVHPNRWEDSNCATLMGYICELQSVTCKDLKTQDSKSELPFWQQLLNAFLMP